MDVKENSTRIDARNYGIDVLKICATVLVFLVHTIGFYPTDTDPAVIDKYTPFGFVGVHIFFIISGFLMVNSIEKRNYDTALAGKSSVNFVMDKFKRIAMPVWIVSAMYLFMFSVYYIYIYIYNPTINSSASNILSKVSSIFDLIAKIIPEFFVVTNVGGLWFVEGSGIIWYISVMLLLMVPFAYLLIRKKDFFIYVFAPITAILLLGYLRIHSYPSFLSDPNIHEGYYRIIRGICGMCFGVISWTIYNKILNTKESKLFNIFLTVAEIVIYIISFAVFVLVGDKPEQILPLLLLMPIAIAITFSKKSYASKLFTAKWMSMLGTWSLYINLNHYIGICIIMVLFKGKGYLLCTGAAFILTIIISVINVVVEKLIRKLIEKIRAKTILSKTSKT